MLEFHERRMAIDEEQLKYIKEEIVADYIGEEVGKIFEQEKRFPTAQEYVEIEKRAIKRAEEIIGPCEK